MLWHSVEESMKRLARLSFLGNMCFRSLDFHLVVTILKKEVI